eukprot:4295512-Pyramimonas_sp.AAC.1
MRPRGSVILRRTRSPSVQALQDVGVVGARTSRARAPFRKGSLPQSVLAVAQYGPPGRRGRGR